MSDDSQDVPEPRGSRGRRWGPALALALWAGWSASAAATPEAPPAAEPAMQFHLVRSAEPGCEPHCPEWIAAQGKIEEGTAHRFKQLLRQVGSRKLPVLIDSSGGRVSESFEIGRLIRARGLDVVVSATELVACDLAEPACLQAEVRKIRLGLPQAAQSKCASACAFVLAAGARRLVGPTAFVGLHRIRTFRVMLTYRGSTAGPGDSGGEAGGWVTEKVVEIATPKRTYDQIRRYFTEMGIDLAVMPLILSTPADRLRWLTRGELRRTRLATHAMGATELLVRLTPAGADPEAETASEAVIETTSPALP